MNGKVLLIGPVGSGKTTLKHALTSSQDRVFKTQSLEFEDDFIDSPGEYFEWPGLHGALTTTAADVDIVLVTADATAGHVPCPHGIAGVFQQRIVGVITKIDDPKAKVTEAQEDLARALGVEPSEITLTSAVRGDGIETLAKRLQTATAKQVSG